MATKKKDGRESNGAPNRGLGEASYLVRGTAELFEAMRARAEAEDWSLADTWRRAATEFLARAGQSPEGVRALRSRT